MMHEILHFLKLLNRRTFVVLFMHQKAINNLDILFTNY